MHFLWMITSNLLHSHVFFSLLLMQIYCIIYIMDHTLCMTWICIRTYYGQISGLLCSSYSKPDSLSPRIIYFGSCEDWFPSVPETLCLVMMIPCNWSVKAWTMCFRFHQLLYPSYGYASPYSEEDYSFNFVETGSRSIRDQMWSSWLS